MDFIMGMFAGVAALMAIAYFSTGNSIKACMDASGAPACEIRYVPLEKDDVATS